MLNVSFRLANHSVAKQGVGTSSSLSNSSLFQPLFTLFVTIRQYLRKILFHPVLGRRPIDKDEDEIAEQTSPCELRACSESPGQTPGVPGLKGKFLLIVILPKYILQPILPRRQLSNPSLLSLEP
jgi:hypothetical protein